MGLPPPCASSWRATSLRFFITRQCDIVSSPEAKFPGLWSERVLS
jgi:hypothetical protein